MIDTETTGTDPQKHNIAEVAIKVIDTGTGKVIDTYQSLIQLSKHEWSKADPGALKVNNFTFQELEKGAKLSAVHQKVKDLFKKHQLTSKNAFILCQNPSFDRPFFAQIISEQAQRNLKFPYHWLDLASMNWALEMKKIKDGSIDPYKIPISKDWIAKSHQLPPEEHPHRAMNGVDHLLTIFYGILGY